MLAPTLAHKQQPLQTKLSSCGPSNLEGHVRRSIRSSRKEINPIYGTGDTGRMMFQRLAGLWEDGLIGASGCEPGSWGAGGVGGGVGVENLERALN